MYRSFSGSVDRRGAGDGFLNSLRHSSMTDGSLRVMGRFARQATEEERDRFTDRLEISLVDAYARSLRHMVARNASRRRRNPKAGSGGGQARLKVQVVRHYRFNLPWLQRRLVGRECCDCRCQSRFDLANQFADLVNSTGSVSSAIDAWSFESESSN